MKKAISYITSIVLLFSVCFGYADTTTEHVVWNKLPIEINLPINKEKIISFPGSIKPFLPSALLNTGELRSINNNGVLYLTAKKPFGNHIAEIKLQNSGEIILLEISARKNANDNQISVLVHKQVKNHVAVQPRLEDTSLGFMISWVANNLYPINGIPNQPNWLHRIPMHTSHFVPLYMGGAVSSMPLASWRAGDYYLTAVLMRNAQADQTVTLSHKMLRGNWRALSFFRVAKGDAAFLTKDHSLFDSTTAILVSTVPFEQALKEGYNNV